MCVCVCGGYLFMDLLIYVGCFVLEKRAAASSSTLTNSLNSWALSAQVTSWDRSRVEFSAIDQSSVLQSEGDDASSHHQANQAWGHPSRTRSRRPNQMWLNLLVKLSEGHNCPRWLKPLPWAVMPPPPTPPPTWWTNARPCTGAAPVEADSPVT